MRKRLFDVTVISLAAVVWVPVVALSALAVLLFSGRPVFYRSERWVGPRKIIDMVKLRVMVRDANKVLAAPVEAGRFLSTPADSPLYTGVGRILDRLGVNEIPQFVHVLKGDMSLVGARPLTHVVREGLVEQHQHIDDRWHTPAGLTGLPQLVGRSSLTDAQRLQLEAAYSRASVQHYRLSLDFMILLNTVLITFGLRKPMTFESALALTTRRRLTATLHVPEHSMRARGATAEPDVA